MRTRECARGRAVKLRRAVRCAEIARTRGAFILPDVYLNVLALGSYNSAVLVGQVGDWQVDPPLISTRPLFNGVTAGEDRAAFNPPGLIVKVAEDGL